MGHLKKGIKLRELVKQTFPPYRGRVSFSKRFTSVRNPWGKFGRRWFRRYAVCTLGKLKTTFREWDFPANKLVCRNHPCETFPPLCPGVAADLPRDVAESLSRSFSLFYSSFYFSLTVTFRTVYPPDNEHDRVPETSSRIENTMIESAGNGVCRPRAVYKYVMTSERPSSSCTLH